MLMFTRRVLYISSPSKTKKDSFLTVKGNIVLIVHADSSYFDQGLQDFFFVFQVRRLLLNQNFLCILPILRATRNNQ